MKLSRLVLPRALAALAGCSSTKLAEPAAPARTATPKPAPAPAPAPSGA